MNKYIPFVLVFFLLALFSCKENDPNSDSSYMNEAIITGYDMRMCACCGGFMLSFEKNASPYQGVFYLVSNMPTNSGIKDSTKFPINVLIDWSIDSLNCGKKINIKRIKIK